MNERIQKLRELSVTTPVHIDLERAKIETEFYKENDGKYSIPVMRSMVLKEYFSKKTLYLGEGELIVGEKGKDPQASPTFPELCCHSVEDMTVMSERDLVSFHTTEEDRKLQAEEIIPFWKGRSMREKLLAAMTPEWNDCYSAGMFTEFMEQRGPGHTCGGEQVFTTGYMDYKEKIKKTMINKIVKLLTLPLIKNPPSTNFSINFLTIFAYLFCCKERASILRRD